MKEYAITYRLIPGPLMERDMEDPVFAFKSDNGVVTLTGESADVEAWKHYFQSEDWAEGHRKESDEPLRSALTGSTYPSAIMLVGANAESRYDEAVAKIGGRSVTIGGGSYRRARIEDR